MDNTSGKEDAIRKASRIGVFTWETHVRQRRRVAVFIPCCRREREVEFLSAFIVVQLGI